ncbi:MAG TPA: hypothetical protein VGK29_21750 [Paludibaculum sp.]
MRFLISLVLLAGPLAGSWPRVLESAGLPPDSVEILTGDSRQSRTFGFRDTGARVTVRSVVDSIDPSLEIVWQEAVAAPVFAIPGGATVFTRERWTGAPLAAGWQSGGRVHIWTAVAIGERGYERFPYLPQALAELGVRARVESRGLWAFFDSSYRLRADPEYLAARWRRGGIAALHIAAWHYWEPDPQRDLWLRKLIAACHRHAITTYAWIELPHVSEEFWSKHPEWREQTAAGQDAHLDWRKLMNLSDPACSAAVERGLRALVERFDWDGVNLGELYFESLEGYQNPARFTPFHTQVRDEFRQAYGFDPSELYDAKSRRHHARDAAPMRLFLDYRAKLAARLQRQWLDRLQSLKAGKPWLNVVLTHVDDRFDATMRDKLGADAASLLPAAAALGATFLVEDPATVWHLGPERYPEMARRYAAITPPGARLAVDLNIVERYQDVYPTKQQTGGELLQLLHNAARAFPRVALYFENSIAAVDWPMLAGAAAAADVKPLDGGALQISSAQPVALHWPACAQVNGKPWPVRSGDLLLLPPGGGKVEGCNGPDVPALLDFNGQLHEVEARNGQLSIRYSSESRAIAILPGGREILLQPGENQTARLP